MTAENSSSALPADDFPLYLDKDEVQFVKEFSAAAERLRQDPEAWAEYNASRERWDAIVFAPLSEESRDTPT